MSALLLAPYNDSMRLGAGYNSYLQTPCLGNAVTIGTDLVTTKPNGNPTETSQTVTYSASFVDKMSEVVRSMNISAGSSIRTGSVTSSAGSSTIDEAKFAESDLNAVLSVKVINQTRTLHDDLKFNELDKLKGASMDSTLFHSIYGDTFISGFIEGGELHGIVSIKVLDASRKQDIKKNLKAQFNGGSSEWSPSAAGGLSTIMSQTEVTVTVNYSGGGIIKDPSQEWTLESLMAAASAFPANVASCPQRTSAILSRYDTIPSFVEWRSTISPSIEVRRYDGVQRYTSELLDTFIEYKSNLLLLNNAIRHPELYKVSSAVEAVPLTLQGMIGERRKLKSEMEKMVSRIELLDKDPSAITRLDSNDEIQAPELQRARLPMKVDLDGQDDLLQRFLDGSGLSSGPLVDKSAIPGQDLGSQLTKEIERTTKDNELREAQEKWADAERKINEDHEAVVKQLKDQQVSDMNKLKAEFAAAEKATKEKHDGEVLKLKEDASNARKQSEDQQKKDTDTLRGQHESTLKTVKDDNEKEMTKLKDQHATEVEKLTADYNRKDSECQRHMKVLDSTPELTISSICIDESPIMDFRFNKDVYAEVEKKIRENQSGPMILGGRAKFTREGFENPLYFMVTYQRRGEASKRVEVRGNDQVTWD